MSVCELAHASWTTLAHLLGNAAVVARIPEARGLDSQRQGRIFTAGSVLGAVAMSSCCILPLVLFSLGITGVWLGTLSSLYPYKWYFFLATAGFLGGGFYWVYRKAPAIECARGSHCARPASTRVTKIALWTATALALVALAFPYVAPVFLET